MTEVQILDIMYEAFQLAMKRLKPAQITRHKLSMRNKRFVLSLRQIQYLEELLEA